jgi:streptogramin lyase
MAYLSDLWITDPNNAKLFKIVSDQVVSSAASEATPRAICVDLNMVDVWVVNTTAGNISQFNNGVRIKDIRVGKTPMGIAQDADGALWVANYSSNTVSKIVNGIKVMDISVGVGPRGVCVTPDGTVWVANYISGTVSKIVNDVKVKDIKVGLNPYGICADKYGNVWTANAGSNTVSKIEDSKKVLDINVGKVPQGICSDKYGTIWVSNYLSDTVSKIVGGIKTLDIVVGDGPFAISTISDGSIYVANYLGTTVTKIAGDIRVTDIEVCNNPCSFGDFTGNQAYIIFKGSNNGGGHTIISYEDLDPNLQQMITNASYPTALPDANVTHSHATYDTVKKALDFLLYDAPVITSFTNNVNTAEIGSAVTAINLNWALNKAMVSQSINNGVGAIPIGTTTKQLTSLNLTADTSWVLTVTDDVEATVTKTTSLKFQNKRYWGVAAAASLTNAQILALSGEFATDYNMSKTLDASGGKYLYFAVPTAFGLDASKFKVGGLANSDWVKTTVQFTNASGHTSSYDVFRSGNIQTGAAIGVVIS